jgi:uncharacterized membrane protein
MLVYGFLGTLFGVAYDHPVVGAVVGLTLGAYRAGRQVYGHNKRLTSAVEKVTARVQHDLEKTENNT